MLHLNIHDGAIIRDMGTFHGINKGPSTIGHMVCDDPPSQQPNIDPKMKTLVPILDMKNSIAQVKYVDLKKLMD